MNSSNTHLTEQTQEDNNEVAQITSVPSSQNAPLPTETTEVITSNYVPDSFLVDEHDAMIADLIAEEHGENLLFDTTTKQWRVFSGGMWCEAEEAERMVWGFYCKVILDINNQKYSDLLIGDPKWLKSAMNQSKASSALKIVQVLTAKGAKSLDANPNLIGIQDIVYDIQHNGVRPALASDLIFKSLGTTHDSGALCPEWDKFLNTAMQGDQEMIDYLQRLVGYFLTASTKEQKIYYFYGSGANGKSTFLDLVKTLLGSYSVKISSDTFIKGRSGSTSLGKRSSMADLKGARLAITDETNDSDVSFDTQILKSISGDDEITARRLRQNPITFKSTAKIVMYGNDKPHGNINDEGFWRRFCFIHFSHVVTKKQKDKDLLEKLKAELPGIFNWALEGLKNWSKNETKTPQKITDDSKDYREELDTVSEFLRDNTAESVGHLTATITLFEVYVVWCSNNMKVTETKQAFSKRTKWYFETKTTATPHKTKKMRGYMGVKLV
jgi:putative DNA primase/helicase